MENTQKIESEADRAGMILSPETIKKHGDWEAVGTSRLNKQRDIELMLLAMLAFGILLNLFGLKPYIHSYIKDDLILTAIYSVVFIPVLAAFLLQGKSFKKLFMVEKGQWWLVLLLLLFKVVVAVVMHFTNVYPITPAARLNVVPFLVELLYEILVVGFVEEFVFRIYIQDTLVNLFGRLSFLAPLVSGVAFGFFHGVNNSMTNVIFNIVMGLAWGYTRYFSRKATFTALAVTHGFSNCMNTIINLFCGIMF